LCAVQIIVWLRISPPLRNLLPVTALPRPESPSSKSPVRVSHSFVELAPTGAVGICPVADERQDALSQRVFPSIELRLKAFQKESEGRLIPLDLAQIHCLHNIFGVLLSS
jgi:hypothetical protein